SNLLSASFSFVLLASGGPEHSIAVLTGARVRSYPASVSLPELERKEGVTHRRRRRRARRKRRDLFMLNTSAPPLRPAAPAAVNDGTCTLKNDLNPDASESILLPKTPTYVLSSRHAF